MKKEINAPVAIIAGLVTLALVIGLGLYFINPPPVLRPGAGAAVGGGGAPVKGANGKIAPPSRPTATLD